LPNVAGAPAAASAAVPMADGAPKRRVAPKRTVFRPVNHHLLGDDWLEMIVWDEEDAQQKRIAVNKNNKVVIEFNDDDILFEDPDADLDDYLDELAPDGTKIDFYCTHTHTHTHTHI